ncbi:glycosyltransferase family 2 protein [Desulfosarcina sp.]|uniref:glycosyltransferase family 2 protein n=1 Tax=Desulfosarcina sp. TaxID=2027861 RepID=UPI0039709BAA
MRNQTTLSAAIITYNEEKNIQACLDSISDFVDEIIVLDSFSTDATESICLANPKVQFSQHPFDGHIEQKNRALAKCTSEWILCLDADERVTPRLRASIEALLDRDPDLAGVKFPRLTYHMHRNIRHGGWYPNARCRLVRRGMAVWGGENPHDKLIANGKVKRIKGDLIHLTARDLSHQVDTINKFSSIAALMRFNRGKHFYLWRLIFKPISKFFEMYLLKAGFLDGMQGFIIAVSSSYSSFLKEAKLFELDRLDTDTPSNLSTSLYARKRRPDR